MPLSPTDMAAKWARNLGQAGTAIQAGVNAVTVSPMQKAAQRQDAYLAGVQRAVTSGKYSAGLNKVSLQQWQQAVIQKGLPRIAAGAAAGQQKMADFLGKWMPYMGQLQSKLASMPRGDLQTNIQRAITAIEHNAAFKG